MKNFLKSIASKETYSSENWRGLGRVLGKATFLALRFFYVFVQTVCDLFISYTVFVNKERLKGGEREKPKDPKDSPTPWWWKG